MNRVILFGGTGRLGKQVAIDLQLKNYKVTAVVRNSDKADSIREFVSDTIIADVTDPSKLKNICEGFNIIVSTLGKSVSLNDKSKPGFMKIDLKVNSNILKEGIAASVKKFVYVSAFGAENSLHLRYFNAHHLFSEKLKQSGMNYSIIKPPAIFSAFIDLIELAEKGRLVTIGKGDKQTNPIYERDLAKICVSSIGMDNVTIEAGGKRVYTRHEINQIIQQHAAPGKKILNIPAGLVKIALPLLGVFNKNGHDKFAFFMDVMEHDLVAPRVGETTLENYLSDKLYLTS